MFDLTGFYHDMTKKAVKDISPIQLRGTKILEVVKQCSSYIKQRGNKYSLSHAY